MAKHIPGPWAWQRFDGSDFDEELYAIEADLSVIRLDHIYALDASMDKTWPADKALLAAAPDLLEACEAAKNALLNIDTVFADDLSFDAGLLLDAAIAKAKGD